MKLYILLIIFFVACNQGVLQFQSSSQEQKSSSSNVILINNPLKSPKLNCFSVAVSEIKMTTLDFNCQLIIDEKSRDPADYGIQFNIFDNEDKPLSMKNNIYLSDTGIMIHFTVYKLSNLTLKLVGQMASGEKIYTAVDFIVTKYDDGSHQLDDPGQLLQNKFRENTSGSFLDSNYKQQ